jgi:T-complex protein 1 subunit gamma
LKKTRILLLDCGLEYKKGESQLNVQRSNEKDFEKLLQLEDDYIKQVCEEIIALKPDLVVTEKGVSDLAQYYFVKNNISCIRRLRKTDNNRIARATGATIFHRISEIKESDIGKGCIFF